jgi:hypothetical protein
LGDFVGNLVVAVFVPEENILSIRYEALSLTSGSNFISFSLAFNDLFLVSPPDESFLL